MSEQSVAAEIGTETVHPYDAVRSLARMGIELDCAVLLTRTPLTPREIEITTCIMRGFNNREIAQRLGITTSTLRTHIKRIYRKMGSHSKPNLMLRVLAMLADKVERSRAI